MQLRVCQSTLQMTIMKVGLEMSHTRETVLEANCPHPPGFKELCSRVEKISGRTGDCNWLEGFKEASSDWLD